MICLESHDMHSYGRENSRRSEERVHRQDHWDKRGYLTLLTHHQDSNTRKLMLHGFQSPLDLSVHVLQICTKYSVHYVHTTAAILDVCWDLNWFVSLSEQFSREVQLHIIYIYWCFMPWLLHLYVSLDLNCWNRWDEVVGIFLALF